MSEIKTSVLSSEDWMNTKWRPMMGWTYMITCLFDFVLGPIFYNILQLLNHNQQVAMWQPLTLGGGGLYHLAMGAVLGIAAWSRGQEKIAVIDKVATQPLKNIETAE
jgi:hypothetical protein